jgi:hypothetical protein
VLPPLTPCAQPRMEAAASHKALSVLISSKYDKPPVLRPLSEVPPSLMEAFANFVASTGSPAAVAVAAIEALFERDFGGGGGGEHWVRDGSGCAPRADGGWDVQESASWDHKDINAQAKSTAAVYISRAPDEVRIVSYSYYVSG